MAGTPTPNSSASAFCFKTRGLILEEDAYLHRAIGRGVEEEFCLAASNLSGAFRGMTSFQSSDSFSKRAA